MLCSYYSCLCLLVLFHFVIAFKGDMYTYFCFILLNSLFALINQPPEKNAFHLFLKSNLLNATFAVSVFHLYHPPILFIGAESQCLKKNKLFRNLVSASSFSYLVPSFPFIESRQSILNGVNGINRNSHYSVC